VPRILDVRGKGCPNPAYEALKVFSELRSGEELVVYTDEEQCLYIIKGFIDALDNGVVEHRKKDGYLEIIIKNIPKPPGYKRMPTPSDLKC